MAISNSPVDFFNNHKILCMGTLGLALVFGYLGPRLVRWIGGKLGLVKKTDQVAHQSLTQLKNTTVEPAHFKPNLSVSSSDARVKAAATPPLSCPMHGDIKEKKHSDLKLEQQKALFMQGGLHQKPAAADSWKLEVQLTDEQKKDLAAAYQAGINARCHPKGAPYTVYAGALHLIIQLHSLPGIVFKLPNYYENLEKEIDEEVSIYKEAHRVVKEQNLYLIRIPQCNRLDASVNGKKIAFLVQEKMEVNGTFDFQKGLYRFAFDQLPSAIKPLFEQLTTFICLTSFSDVKYDNIPLLANGEGVALYDLDQKDFIGGLFPNEIDKKGGLFSYVPHEQLLEALAARAQQILVDAKKRELFLEAWKSNEKYLKEKIKERAIKQQKRQAFFQRLGIKAIGQAFNLEQIPYSSDTKQRWIEENLLALINEEIKRKQNFDLMQSRCFKMNCEILEQKAMAEGLFADYEEFCKTVSLALDALKRADVFFDYKYSPARNLATIHA